MKRTYTHIRVERTQNYGSLVTIRVEMACRIADSFIKRKKKKKKKELVINNLLFVHVEFI